MMQSPNMQNMMMNMNPGLANNPAMMAHAQSMMGNPSLAATLARPQVMQYLMQIQNAYQGLAQVAPDLLPILMGGGGVSPFGLNVGQAPTSTPTRSESTPSSSVASAATASGPAPVVPAAGSAPTSAGPTEQSSDDGRTSNSPADERSNNVSPPVSSSSPPASSPSPAAAAAPAPGLLGFMPPPAAFPPMGNPNAPPEERFSSQLQQLQDMGFPNR